MVKAVTHGDEKVAYKDADIHMEAEICPAATASSIEVVIHAHDLQPAEGEKAWEFEQVYTDAGYLVIKPNVSRAH